jgi:hypothetical protein
VSAEEQERERDRNDQQPGKDGANKAFAGPITKRARLGRICSAERISACEPYRAGEDQSSEDDEDPGNTRPNPRIGPIHSSTYRLAAALAQAFRLLARAQLRGQAIWSYHENLAFVKNRLHLAPAFKLADEAPLTRLSTAHDLKPALL